MSGIIFVVCSTSWISRCSLAAISVIFFLIRSGSRVPCQREDKKVLPVKVSDGKTRANESSDGEVETHESGVAQPVECEEERTLRKIWAIPTSRRMPKKNKAVFQIVSGSWCGTQAEIHSSFLKWGDRTTLKMQIPGNRKTGMTLRALSVPGNWCGRWTQRRILITWRSQIINTWRRFSNICKRIWNHNERVAQHLQFKQWRPMYRYGDCS